VVETRLRILLLIAIVQVTAMNAYASVTDAYTKVVELMKSRQYAAAITKLDQMIATHPRDANLYCQRGIAYFSLGKTRLALENFDRALAIDPKFLPALKERAGTYMTLGELNSAVSDTTSIIKLTPVDRWALELRGQAFFRLKNYLAAAQDFSATIDLGNKKAGIYCTRAQCYIHTNRPGEALADLEQAAKISPNDVQVLLWRGAAFGELGYLDKSLTCFNKAVRLNPSWIAYSMRGNTYSKAGYYKEAISDFNVCLRLVPNQPEVRQGRMLAYLGLNDCNGAISDYRAWLKAVPQHTRADALCIVSVFIAGRAKVYEQTSSNADLAKLYSCAIKMFPDNAAFYRMRAFAYYRLGQYANAIDDCSRVVLITPNYAPAYETRGNLYRKIHEYRKAVADYNTALDLCPTLAGAIANRAATKKDLGDYSDAIQDYTDLIDAQPKNPEWYRERAGLYDKLGKHDLALSDLEKAKEAEKNRKSD
jgi:tetratricopeptide (TPR) repeat protein